MKKNYFLILVLIVFSGALQAQTYNASNISLLSNWFNPNEPVATAYGIKYNGIWGWHDGAGNEYALVGAASGTYFIDITNPANPVQRDYVAGRKNNCIWREIKTYGNYCYMVSDDASPNSLQIVDLSYLPDSVHVVYDDDDIVERVHTIFIEDDKLYCGSVHGGSTGTSSMAVFSLANPAQPTLIRRLNQDFSLNGNSVHDMFVKNDTIYASCGYDGLYIFKLDAANHFQFLNSVTTYIDQGYNHSSALDVTGQYLYFMDEVPDGMDVKVLDVSNFSNLTVVDNFHSNDNATPHNPFVKDNLLYISYYQDGLQVFDISNPSSPVLAGFFDTYWQNPAGVYPSPAYAGAWGAYPWLPSGNIIVSDMQNGLFVLDASGIQGIGNNVKNTFNLRPNPVISGNSIQIDLGRKVDKAVVQITDLSGKEVMSREFAGTGIELSTLGFSAGLYMVKIEAEGISTVRKLTIAE
jgi:choice-of-anchor B domain-containing protein